MGKPAQGHVEIRNNLESARETMPESGCSDVALGTNKTCLGLAGAWGDRQMRGKGSEPLELFQQHPYQCSRPLRVPLKILTLPSPYLQHPGALEKWRDWTCGIGYLPNKRESSSQAY